MYLDYLNFLFIYMTARTCIYIVEYIGANENMYLFLKKK